MSRLPPQGLHTSFIGAVAATYPAAGSPQINLTSSGANFKSQAIQILNQDASIVCYASYDGTTDNLELDPADASSWSGDAFYPPSGKIWLRSASGTPRMQVQAFA